MTLSKEVVGEAAVEIEVMAAIERAADQEENVQGSGAISTIVIIIAMQTEALPLVNTFQLTEDPDSPFPKGVPWVRYHGTYKGLEINIIWPGKDSLLGVDSVGTISASLVTYSSIQALRPDLIINAVHIFEFSLDEVKAIIFQLENERGVRNFMPRAIHVSHVLERAKGASIADVYLASEVAFHDRRIPIPVFDQYGVGARKTFSTPNLVREINLKIGKLSTGDSLDMSPHDEASIMANEAVIKDMEGAAVAYVASLFSVPTIFLKAVTDIIDGDKPTAEEFLENLAAVTAALDQAVSQVVDFFPGRSLSEL